MSETAVLHIHICDQRRGYNVTFATEEQALAFLAPRMATHTWWELNDSDGGSVPQSWSRLLDFIYPLCEHQLSQSSCYGPDHFMSADQERAMDFQYAD